MSVPQFHSLLVNDVRRETPTCVSVSFEIPDPLQEEFKYHAGQYITLKSVIDGEELRRSYSLCSSPLESDFRVAIKQVHHGKFSSYANQELKKGDRLDVMTPMGNFVFNPDSSSEKLYILFAAGSGITPILSIAKTILQTESQSNLVLVYGNQFVKSIIFKEEIEGLKNKYMDRLQVIHILSKERMESDLNYGRINAEKCEQLFTHIIPINKANDFFICGPEEMIQDIKNYLISKNIPTQKIHFELFTSSTSEAKKAAYKESHKAYEGKVCQLTIKVDDRSFDLTLPYNGDTILDAALKHGADLPFACKGGVCCTCKAKIMEGEVEMEVNYALEEEEVQQGFVLTCQSHPTSPRVVIDFDQR